MTITLHTQPAPTIDRDVEAALLSMYPRVFLKWNSHWKELDEGKWDARWEIWIELTDVSHPQAKNKLAPSDKWNTDAQCWMRRLQAYTNADGSFAPADWRLIQGLEMADTWANRRFYEERIEAAAEAQEAADRKATSEMHRGLISYYDRYTTTSVGRHVNSGWRWRIN